MNERDPGGDDVLSAYLDGELAPSRARGARVATRGGPRRRAPSSPRSPRSARSCVAWPRPLLPAGFLDDLSAAGGADEAAASRADHAARRPCSTSMPAAPPARSRTGRDRDRDAPRPRWRSSSPLPCRRARRRSPALATDVRVHQAGSAASGDPVSGLAPLAGPVAVRPVRRRPHGGVRMGDGYRGVRRGRAAERGGRPGPGRLDARPCPRRGGDARVRGHGADPLADRDRSGGPGRAGARRRRRSAAGERARRRGRRTGLDAQRRPLADAVVGHAGPRRTERRASKYHVRIADGPGRGRSPDAHAHDPSKRPRGRALRVRPDERPGAAADSVR